jgi:hypothetical protein
MNEMFSQGGKGSVGIQTNKQAIARHFGVKQSEVIYAEVGKDIAGYKVIYDKVTQKSYSLPTVLNTGTTIVSLSVGGILTLTGGPIDLGALAVNRGEFITLPGSFDSGANLLVRNELLTHDDKQYRWDGSYPKVVPASSSPEETGGIHAGAWVGVRDITSEDLGQPTSSWLIGKAATLQDLKSFDVVEGFTYETDGYDTVGDKGDGKYVISSTIGDDPELATLCTNGLYAILQHDGVIKMEQLGAKFGSDANVEPNVDSWPAFYAAYTLCRRREYKRGLQFILSGQSYRVSKPVLITSCMKLTVKDESQTTRIFYDGGKVTPEEVPDIPGVYAGSGDTPIQYQNIIGYCIFVHRMAGATAAHTYYSSLFGVWFKPSSLFTRGYADYGLYVPYIAKCEIKNARFEHCSYGRYSRDTWSLQETGTVYFQGNSPVTNGIGYWNEPSYAGTSAGGAGGTSNILNIVGTNGFRTAFKIASWTYSVINGSHIGGAGTSVAWEFHWSRGITVNGFGMEGVRNKDTDTGFMRFYNSSVCVTSVTAAADVQVAGRYLIQCSGISKVDFREMALQAMTNTGTALNLCSVETGASLIVGDVQNDSIITAVGSVVGKLDSNILFTGTVGISNTSSGTTNVVTFSRNIAKWRYRGTALEVYLDMAWTGGPATGSFNIYGLPVTANMSCTLPVRTGSFNAVPTSIVLEGTSRVVLGTATNVTDFPVPATGALLLTGSYVYHA